MKRKLFIIAALAFAENCFAQGALQNDSIPFLHRNHLFVQATVNDSVDCHVVFDTGAANIFGVDSVFLTQSNWKPKVNGRASSGGNAGRTIVQAIFTIKKPTEVSFGNHRESHQVIPIYQLRDIAGRYADGISGLKDIYQYPFELNYEHSFMKLYKKDNPNLEGYERIPIQFEQNRILMEAEVMVGGRSIKGTYLMDTGSPGVVHFTAAAAEKFQMDSIPGKRSVCDVMRNGLGNQTNVSNIRMKSDYIVLGGDTIKDKTIQYTPDGVGSLGDEKMYLGLIGNRIWSSYNLVVDVQNKALYLKRFKADSPENNSYDYTFKNRTDIGPGWVVHSLIHDGDAARGGMELGDTITAVNGRNVASYTWEEEFRIYEKSVQVLDVKGLGGEMKHVVLEKRADWR